MKANYLIIASGTDGDKVFGRYSERETAHDVFENIKKKIEDYSLEGFGYFILYEVVRNKKKKIETVESVNHRTYMEELKKDLKNYLKNLGFEVE